ncbi:hypothetical protein M0R36_11265 [bacterium]|jgi:hypothetical protein|nr:hypothetical protein [bacterium]
MKAILTIGHGDYKFTKEMEVPDDKLNDAIEIPFIYYSGKFDEKIEVNAYEPIDSYSNPNLNIELKVTKLIFMLDKIETLPSGEKVALFTLPGGGLKTTGDILEM